MAIFLQLVLILTLTANHVKHSLSQSVDSVNKQDSAPLAATTQGTPLATTTQSTPLAATTQATPLAVTTQVTPFAVQSTKMQITRPDSVSESATGRNKVGVPDLEKETADSVMVLDQSRGPKNKSRVDANSENKTTNLEADEKNTDQDSRKASLTFTYSELTKRLGPLRPFHFLNVLIPACAAGLLLGSIGILIYFYINQINKFGQTEVMGRGLHMGLSNTMSHRDGLDHPRRFTRTQYRKSSGLYDNVYT